MPNIINWERAPVTSNIAVTIPRANYPELVFANEDDHGNVTSCKDGAILSDFTVIERRPATPVVEEGTLWSVAEYEKRGLVMISTDKIVPGEPGLVCEFGWRECGSGQHPGDYKGKIETEGEYWRPVLVHWQKPGPAKTPEVIGKVGDAVSLDVVSVTANDLSDEQQYILDQLRSQIKTENAGISGQHPTPLSVDILNQAIEAQRDRASTYDSPAGERSMGKTVAMFNILHGFDLTEEQGWQFMELLKMVRSSQGDFKLDNYVDGSSYASLAGDAAYQERGGE